MRRCYLGTESFEQDVLDAIRKDMSVQDTKRAALRFIKRNFLR